MKNLIKFSAIPVLAVAFSAPALAAPKTYAVDPTHSFANFSYNHMGLSEQESRFDTTGGSIVYDPVAKTAAVNRATGRCMGACALQDSCGGSRGAEVGTRSPRCPARGVVVRVKPTKPRSCTFL